MLGRPLPIKTLYRLLDGIDQTIDVHRQSTLKDVLFERLRDSGDTSYVVILDEVDQLEDKSLLYDLYRIPHLTMILISNDEDDLFASTDDRLRSRLTDCERIHFRPCHESELVAILRDRVRWGLTEDIIDTSRLELIAADAGGDARVAIGILRRAARKARGLVSGSSFHRYWSVGRQFSSVHDHYPLTSGRTDRPSLQGETVSQGPLVRPEARSASPSSAYGRLLEGSPIPLCRRTTFGCLRELRSRSVRSGLLARFARLLRLDAPPRNC